MVTHAKVDTELFIFTFRAVGITFPRVIAQKMQKVLSLQACKIARTNHSAACFPCLKSA